MESTCQDGDKPASQVDSPNAEAMTGGDKIGSASDQRFVTATKGAPERVLVRP